MPGCTTGRQRWTGGHARDNIVAPRARQVASRSRSAPRTVVMPREIERKFLVAEQPALGDRPGRALRQAYLAVAADRSVRVRIEDGARATLTLKFGGGTLTRHEYEYELPVGDAEEMGDLRLGAWIEKVRYDIPTGRHVIELDVYGGALEGLMMAEIELDDERDEPVLPSWLGREVSDDPAYANQSLALNGAPGTPR